MRLLYMANAASVHTQKWVNYFSHAGHQVHLVTWRKPCRPSGFAHSVQIHQLVCPPHHALRYGALLEVLCLVRKVKPDVVHAHYLTHFGTVGGLLTRVSSFHPLVITAWGSDVLVQSVGRRRSLVASAVARADCVTCDSPHIASRLLALGARPDAVSIVNFGVHTGTFCRRTPHRDIRAELGLGDSQVVISLRNLKPTYDVATLIRAVPEVLAAKPGVVFVIAGEGRERARLEALAVSLGVATHVRFVGALAHETLPEWLNSADAYVSTSLSDAGIAGSTAEAMACEVPVVVSDFGDNHDWVKDGENGYLFPCGDHIRLAERLIRLLGDEDSRRRLGANGRREITERNDYRREMAHMERIYRELVERCGR